MDTDKAYNQAVKLMAKIKPFIAIFVLIFILLSTYGLYENNKLKKEVKDSCGYERSEKVYCVCQKDFVAQIDITNNPYYNRSQEEFNFPLDPEKN